MSVPLFPPPPPLQHRVRLEGSCTALVAVVRPSGMLDVQLVGDCGLRLIRDGQVVLATEVGWGASKRGCVGV